VTKQRLVICLDGTWNRQDSSTNVLHHFNLVCEGLQPGGQIYQKPFYHQGVGTGVLDSITGGGFGLGLETNVRDAYNWLVQNFHEDDQTRQVDEIYIFGFSRGAYTARSLVGFIGQCGLLRRGAPITVEQLWGDYCILGRQKEERKSIWEMILGDENPTVRPFTTLEREKTLTPDERLLLRWSRRVPITYLGIYDTVGAIGWDALAIPGLTSRMALHNNVRPTTLIQHCRHALSIDEQRSNFNHTPFIAYLSENSEELERVEGAAKSSIDRSRAMWNRKIEQRWFVGAHSNIGGGYASNLLAQRPLQWIMQGAIDCGLCCESLPAAVEPTAEQVLPRDSYAEFAPPLWETILRNKRNFRCIDPDSTLRARRDGLGHGFALETIHEVLDESVTSFWANSGKPISPNLESYLKREDPKALSQLTPARHVWLREGWFPYTALAVWTIVAVFGAYALDSLGGFTTEGLPLWFAYTASLFLPFVDWAESKVTFSYAAGAVEPRARAFLDAVYWTRLLGFVLFAVGALYGACVFFAAGLREQWPISPDFLSAYAVVPLLAALPALFITKPRSKYAWLAVFSGPVTVVLAGAILYALGYSVHTLFRGVSASEFWRSSAGDSLPEQLLPGRLLLLQLLGVYFWRALLWAGEPLGRANLGSITKLQKCPTPKQVTACLNKWRDQLAYTAKPDPSPMGQPARNVRNILRESLWRDMIGFIPVYTMFLLFGLKFATLVDSKDWAAVFGWIPIDGLADFANSKVQFWWVLPLLAAAADYLEDFTHLRYVKLYENEPEHSAPSPILTPFSFLMTLIKDVSFVTAGIITLLGALAGTHAMFSQVADWRAKFAIVLTALGCVGLILLIVAAVAGAIRKRRLQTKPVS
jgi:uncharacterized protein (DUF2235 family)